MRQKAIASVRDERVLEPLIDALKEDKDSAIQNSVTNALGMLKDKSAVKALIDALRDENNDVQISAAQALGMICWHQYRFLFGARGISKKILFSFAIYLLFQWEISAGILIILHESSFWEKWLRSI